jgi:hypothetical protein
VQFITEYKEFPHTFCATSGRISNFRFNQNSSNSYYLIYTNNFHLKLPSNRRDVMLIYIYSVVKVGLYAFDVSRYKN